jgi:glycerol uptake facilitator-like aquaporin
MTNVRAYAAEFLGTLLLALIVILSGNKLLLPLGIPTALLAGTALGLSVYTVGWISGAHLNPAVTIALASLRKISPRDAVSYVLAQLLGAFAAMGLASFLGGQELAVGTPNTASVTLMEAAGAFVLAWGVLAVVHGKVHHAASGLVVGGSLAFGILVAAGLGSNGLLNPAVALAVHSFTLSNLVGPIVGALAGAWAYEWIAAKPAYHPAASAA